VARGQVLLSSDRGSLLALDALDGSLRWITPSGRIFLHHATIGLNPDFTMAEAACLPERMHSAPVLGQSAAYFLPKDTPGCSPWPSHRGAARQPTRRPAASQGRAKMPRRGQLFVELPRTAIEVLGEVVLPHPCPCPCPGPSRSQPQPQTQRDGQPAAGARKLLIAASRDGLFALDAGCDPGSEVAAGQRAGQPARLRLGIPPARLAPRILAVGFLAAGGDKIYWPTDSQVLVISAADGKLLARLDVDPAALGEPHAIGGPRPWADGY